MADRGYSFGRRVAYVLPMWVVRVIGRVMGWHREPIAHNDGADNA